MSGFATHGRRDDSDYRPKSVVLIESAYMVGESVAERKSWRCRASPRALEEHMISKDKPGLEILYMRVIPLYQMQMNCESIRAASPSSRAEASLLLPHHSPPASPYDANVSDPFHSHYITVIRTHPSAGSASSFAFLLSSTPCM